MKPEQQRIKIAETCGWTQCAGLTGICPSGMEDYIPDFCNDLNAMYNAENILLNKSLELFDAYGSSLDACVYPDDSAFHATAAQRAEAFLRTLGLWEDGE